MEHCDLIRGRYDVTTEHCDIIMKHCCVTQSTVISQWSTVMTQRNTVIAKHRTVMSPYSTVLLKTQRFDGAVEHCDVAGHHHDDCTTHCCQHFRSRYL